LGLGVSGGIVGVSVHVDTLFLSLLSILWFYFISIFYSRKIETKNRKIGNRNIKLWIKEKKVFLHII
jgi:hypothetical protein